MGKRDFRVFASGQGTETRSNGTETHLACAHVLLQNPHELEMKSSDTMHVDNLYMRSFRTYEFVFNRAMVLAWFAAKGRAYGVSKGVQRKRNERIIALPLYHRSRAHALR